MAASPPMLELPPELLIRVSDHLTTVELGYFRRTCKHVETVLFDTFAKEFFTKRQFMIEQPSLQALIDISNHPTLSQRLVEVIISTDAINFDANQEGPRGPKAFLEKGYLRRELLLHTGQARDMLVEAFSKLPNLRSVGLRDYPGKGRRRDGETARWRSWGWNWSGGNIEEYGAYCVGLSPMLILPVVIYSLGLARAKPSNIEVFLRSHPKLSPGSFSVGDGYMLPAISPVLAGLQTLMLHVCGSEDRALVPQGYDAWTQAPLKRFLRHTKALETLRLNFEQYDLFGDAILMWLGEPVSNAPHITERPTIDVSPLSLSKLRNLDLGMLNTDSTTLIKVVAKFDLISINLWKVYLRSKDFDESTDDTSPWVIFLETLADTLQSSTRLQRFSVGYARQPARRGAIPPNNLDEDVLFAPSGDPGDRRQSNAEDRVSYRAEYGSNVKQWLIDVAARTWAVRNIPFGTRIDREDDSEDADEDEADEDDNGDDDEDQEEVDDGKGIDDGEEDDDGTDDEEGDDDGEYDEPENFLQKPWEVHDHLFEV
ncbi:hypothetical protein LTR91_013240 [Friedmanniomyces endolithicus]|uniref:F-box domain-containing protein n=1 Tax=Friedmanniomyces endolithicus TaxID=329885 RepID=A0AAN6QQV1_9PEZI|nr:hypothetical protein LTR57_011656 [Friedmanniomyces endolithicus]KAK0977752.1 hypothetical protein LTR91_013240 [Friedmanniomyces endolithicus]KAK1001979.1 hypothetical protein LTS01_004499 [Friedmanniomyces endolithicus]KAK1042796.1 hypothetical protein LTS16_008541 [Friedmanniomyces endolithicus]